MRFIGLVLLLSLAACATPAPVETTAAPPKPIVCTAGPDCDAKWSRAVGWIVSNSNWKIQTQTDQLIQTFNSMNSSSYPGYTITKVATGSGTYEIKFGGACDNIFGCNPPIATARAQFEEYVNAAPPVAQAAKPTPSNTKLKKR